MKKLLITVGALIIGSTMSINAMDPLDIELTRSIDKKLSQIYNEKIEVRDSTAAYNDYILPIILDAKLREEGQTMGDVFTFYNDQRRDTITYLDLSTRNIHLSNFIYNHFSVIVNFFEIYNQKTRQINDYFGANINVIAILHEAESNLVIRNWISGALDRTVNNFFYFLDDLESQQSKDIFFFLFTEDRIPLETLKTNGLYHFLFKEKEITRDEYIRNFNAIYGNFDSRVLNGNAHYEYLNGEMQYPGPEAYRRHFDTVSWYNDINARLSISNFIEICGARAKNILFYGNLAVNRFSQTLLAAEDPRNIQKIINLYLFMSSYDFDGTMDLFNIEIYDEDASKSEILGLDNFPYHFIDFVEKIAAGNYINEMPYVIGSQDMRRTLRFILSLPRDISQDEQIDKFFKIIRTAICGENKYIGTLSNSFKNIAKSTNEAIMAEMNSKRANQINNGNTFNSFPI